MWLSGPSEVPLRLQDQIVNVEVEAGGSKTLLCGAEIQPEFMEESHTKKMSWKVTRNLLAGKLA